MTHAQWTSQLRRILAMVKREPARALESLDALVERIHSTARNGVGDWHLEQTVEMISILQSHGSDHQQSAQTMLGLAERHERQVTYYERAFVAACATAALELVSAGDRPAAERALRRAAGVAARLRPQEKLFRKAAKIVERTAPSRAPRPGTGQPKSRRGSSKQALRMS